MSRIALVGSIGFDRLMKYPGDLRVSLPTGTVENLSVGFVIDSIVENDGGTAGNIAYNLALLSETSEILATAGMDAESYLGRLRDHGVDTTHVHIATDVPTATAYALTDIHGNQITSFYPGACGKPYTDTYSFDALRLMIVSPTAIADMERFPREAKAAGVPLFYDPGQLIPGLSPESLARDIEGSTIVFVNEYELGLLHDKLGWDAKEIARRAGLLIVTLAERGSRLVTDANEELVPAVQVTAVDPTGAGDAYRAGFIAGYVKDLPVYISARVGSVLASFAVERVGCQNHAPTRDELATRYQETYGETWPL